MFGIFPKVKIPKFMIWIWKNFDVILSTRIQKITLSQQHSVPSSGVTPMNLAPHFVGQAGPVKFRKR
jgi:hypothetical protein